jgi:hypothetical protein
MEKIVKEAQVNHLEENKIISGKQHGFRKGRSCQTNLIEFTEQLTQWADEEDCLDVIYLNFAKV